MMTTQFLAVNCRTTHTVLRSQIRHRKCLQQFQVLGTDNHSKMFKWVRMNLLWFLTSEIACVIHVLIVVTALLFQASETFRRSMPNLAHIGSKKFSAIPAAPTQLRREPHYVSDPKIRSRTRTLKKATPGLGVPNIDLMDVPPDNTYPEARNVTENKPYV